MYTLYPEISPYNTHLLKVDDVHQIYVEESGNPDGIPVLFVHGGPGAGSGHRSRCFFDPELYRIVVFDQRGAGRSQPHAELEQNTTDHLLQDMELIREAFGIQRWVVFGGSWGATLGLLYAQAHPSRVLGLILRGVFLGRQRDVDWLYQDGASRLFPDYWEDYLREVPPEQRDQCLQAYWERLAGDNELARMAAAKAWCVWEARCSTLRPNSDLVHFYGDPQNALAMARIEAHYFMHQCFIDENQIIDRADSLHGIPGVIVHGRYDAVCPLENAHTLHRHWHDSELHIIRDAGHTAFEPSIIDALIRATRHMARRLRPRDDAS